MKRRMATMTITIKVRARIAGRTMSRRLLSSVCLLAPEQSIGTEAEPAAVVSLVVGRSSVEGPVVVGGSVCRGPSSMNSCAGRNFNYCNKTLAIVISCPLFSAAKR